MDLKEVEKQQRNKKNNRHPWEQARLEFIYKNLKKHLNESTPVFLDIGCGDTYVAEQLMKRIPNCTFYCVDNAFTKKQLLFYSKKHNNIKVFNNLKEATLQIDSEISFILLLDVIEHVKNDLELLIQIKELEQFSSESKILVTVPAFQSLFTHHDFLLGHYRRYTNQSLEETTLKSGLKTIHKGYFFTSLLLPRLLLKIQELIFKPKSQSTSVATWNRGIFITTLFKNILILDFTISRFLERILIKLPGLSNYIICKKPV